MAHLEWTKGGEADIVAIGADTVTLRSTISSPPGSRIDAVLARDRGASVKFKIHACKRQSDGSFVLEGRPLDLTREMRERLVALTAV